MDNEWKIDEHGNRYREFGNGHREYEMMVRVSGGIEIPQSQLADYNRRQKEAEKRRKAAALEEMKKRPEPKSCPFQNGLNTTCRREGCMIFLDGKCSLAIIADSHGADHPIEKGKKCPLSPYSRCDSCALNNGGCAFVRLAKVNK